VHSPGKVIAAASGHRNLTADPHGNPFEPWVPTPLHQALETPEKQILLAALKANQWNRQLTAEQLDINRTTLYKKMKRYGLDLPEDAADLLRE
jgi:two-component system response regulator HydG